MPNLYETRAARAEDIPFLAAIADATLFPGEMLADMRSRVRCWQIGGRGVGCAVEAAPALTRVPVARHADAVSSRAYDAHIHGIEPRLTERRHHAGQHRGVVWGVDQDDAHTVA